MQAQVISMRTGKDITNPRLCSCGCGQYEQTGRSTTEIWNELRQCGMTTEEDFDKRKRLIEELQRVRA